MQPSRSSIAAHGSVLRSSAGSSAPATSGCPRWSGRSTAASVSCSLSMPRTPGALRCCWPHRAKPSTGSVACAAAKAASRRRRSSDNARGEGYAMNVVVLISARGSNMEALLDADLGANIAAVISNRADARGLVIASARGVATAVVEHRRFSSREAFDAELATTIDRFEPALVVLAGFMRILTPAFVRRYAGRMINIHPSLLPSFPGLDTHRRALEAGVKIP